jgi:hypothetical protein
MQWYYAKNGQQLGPVSEEKILACLHNQDITSQTLVWHEGLTAWVPFRDVAHVFTTDAASPHESPLPAAPASPALWPYEPPRAETDPSLADPELYDWNEGGLGTVFRHTFKLYFRHLWLIVPAYLIIWLPLNLLSAYVEYHLISPDNIWGATRLAQVLDWFFGIIAVVAVVHICHTAAEGAPCSLGGAMLDGIKKWGKMWTTRLLAGVCVIAGFVVFIFPGFYLMVRLSLTDYAVAVENASAPQALTRSFDLTRDRFWRTAGYLTLGTLILLGPSFAAMFLYDILPILESWIASAVLTTSLAIVEIFFIIYGFAIYKHWDAEGSE